MLGDVLEFVLQMLGLAGDGCKYTLGHKGLKSHRGSDKEEEFEFG